MFSRPGASSSYAFGVAVNETFSISDLASENLLMVNTMTSCFYSFVLLLCFFAGLTNAQSTETPAQPVSEAEQDDVATPAMEQQILAIVQPYLDAKFINGVSIGVTVDGQVSFYNFGLAADDGKRPTNETIYEIGSMSKVFTGILLADSVNKGKVALDQKIGSLIEGLEDESPDIAEVTLQQLSNHVSGLPRMPGNLRPANVKDPFADYGRTKMVAFLKETVLLWDPGTKHQYSNLAVGMLGDLMAKVNEKSYQDLMVEVIAKPLNMTDTIVVVPESKMSRFAEPHLVSGAKGERWAFDALVGAGGIRSTTKDMVGFLQANLDPADDSLGNALELAYQVHLKRGKGMPAMGLGWFLRGEDVRWHNGQTGGYHSMMEIDRKRKIGVVVLSNTASGRVDELAIDIGRLVRGEKVSPKKF